ncbi:MAG TPA: PD-(D/E)XK nuclease family protein, partial [Polyangiaceae bacterium]
MSRLPNGSASASDRTLACPAWLALPRIERASEDAAGGTERHAFVRAVLEGTPVERAIEAVSAEQRKTCLDLDWSRLGSDLEAPLETEGAYAVDMRARTARYLGSNIDRAYDVAARAHGDPLGPWEVPGSLDLAGMSREHPRRLVVLDLKGPWADVTPAADNGQGLFFAAAKFLLDDEGPGDIDEVEFRIAHIKVDGAVWDSDRAVYTRLDVDTYLDRYEEALEHAEEARRLVVTGQTPDVSVGAGCRYCPAFEACPANVSLARAMLPELASIDARIGAMTLAEVGAAYEIANVRVKPLLERVLGPLKERVLRDGIAPFPDGERCAKVSSYPESRFSQKLAVALLEQLGASKDQIARCYAPHEVRKVIVGTMPARAK